MVRVEIGLGSWGWVGGRVGVGVGIRGAGVGVRYGLLYFVCSWSRAGRAAQGFLLYSAYFVVRRVLFCLFLL